MHTSSPDPNNIGRPEERDPLAEIVKGASGLLGRLDQLHRRNNVHDRYTVLSSPLKLEFTEETIPGLPVPGKVEVEIESEPNQSSSNELQFIKVKLQFTFEVTSGGPVMDRINEVRRRLDVDVEDDKTPEGKVFQALTVTFQKSGGQWGLMEQKSLNHFNLKDSPSHHTDYKGANLVDTENLAAVMDVLNKAISDKALHLTS